MSKTPNPMSAFTRTYLIGAILGLVVGLGFLLEAFIVHQQPKIETYASMALGLFFLLLSILFFGSYWFFK